KELIRLFLHFFDWKMENNLTFGERVISDVTGADYEFTDKLMGNIFDCVVALAGNSIAINPEEIKKLNRRAGEDAASIVQHKFSVTDMKKSKVETGMDADMAMLLNGYKQWLIQRRIKQLNELGIRRTPHEEQSLVQLGHILQEFKVAVI